jgi:hypothetical protein
LERLLADSASLSDEQRDYLIAEAAVFTAWRRANKMQSETWFSRINDPEILEPLVRSRLEGALCCARERFDEGLSRCELGIAMIKKEATGKPAQATESAWGRVETAN